MRQRLVMVLEREDGDEPMDAVVRRFWSRAAPLRGGDREQRREHPPAIVVDLALARAARDRRTALAVPEKA
jgi:hypothetical protein